MFALPPLPSQQSFLTKPKRSIIIATLREIPKLETDRLRQPNMSQDWQIGARHLASAKYKDIRCFCCSLIFFTVHTLALQKPSESQSRKDNLLLCLERKEPVIKEIAYICLTLGTLLSITRAGPAKTIPIRKIAMGRR